MNNRPPTSGNPGTNGRTLHSPNLAPMLQGGSTTPRLPTNINATMTPQPSHPIDPLLHSPLIVHAKIHTDPAPSNHVSPPVPSLLDMSPSISKMVPKKNGLVMLYTLCIIQTGCELPMNLSQTKSLRSPPLCHRTTMMPPRSSSTELMPGSQLMSLRRLSNYSSAQTFFRITTFPLATSVNFPTPACLHSSCLYHPSAASSCQLLLAINTTIHGHFVMELHSVPLN